MRADEGPPVCRSIFKSIISSWIRRERPIGLRPPPRRGRKPAAGGSAMAIPLQGRSAPSGVIAGCKSSLSIRKSNRSSRQRSWRSPSRWTKEAQSLAVGGTQASRSKHIPPRPAKTDGEAIHGLQGRLASQVPLTLTRMSLFCNRFLNTVKNC
jgi:hypothetical protein